MASRTRACGVNVDDSNRRLYEDLGELARYIERAMRKLEEAGPPVGAATRHLPEATTQLTDLCRLTEAGTHEVMRLAEAIQDNQQRVGRLLAVLADALAADGGGQAAAERLDEAVQALAHDSKRLTDLMTALSFQDLVAQRVQKLAVVLNDVQRRLLELIVVFGPIRSQADPDANDKAGDMLRQLEASKSTSLDQALVDEILTQCGFR